MNHFVCYCENEDNVAHRKIASSDFYRVEEKQNSSMHEKSIVRNLSVRTIPSLAPSCDTGNILRSVSLLG